MENTAPNYRVTLALYNESDLEVHWEHAENEWGGRGERYEWMGIKSGRTPQGGYGRVPARFEQTFEGNTTSYKVAVEQAISLVKMWAGRHGREHEAIVPCAQVSVSDGTGMSFMSSAMTPAEDTLGSLRSTLRHVTQ